MISDYIIITILGFLLYVIFDILLTKLAKKYNMLSPARIPLTGGIAIGLSFILVCLFSLLFSRNLSYQISGILFTSFIMLIFGVIDDWRELSIRSKFLAQIISGSLLMLFGTRTQIFHIGNLPNIFITLIWIIGITNAFNHLDVMDGLAGVTAIIVSFSFLIISVFNKDNYTLILSLSLLGPLFGFLFRNFPPAKVYMGNSGSHLLGFVLAGISIMISYAPLERRVALVTPLLILGLPILDTAFLIFMRISKKKLPFKKSNDHLPLRLLALGYSKRKALLTMFSLCLFFSICAIMVSRFSNFVGISIIIFVIVVSWLFTKKMSKVAIND